MSNIANLQRQHRDISEVIEKIEKTIGSTKIIENSNSLSLDIAFLSGKMVNHLQSEDKFLYPSLLDHQSPAIKAISSRFIREMGTLSETFVRYKAKYMIANNIKTSPDEFIKESNEVFEAIRKRVLAEEKELYPLKANE
jgi:hemerythrin-like domain-containing protein